MGSWQVSELAIDIVCRRTRPDAVTEGLRHIEAVSIFLRGDSSQVSLVITPFIDVNLESYKSNAGLHCGDPGATSRQITGRSSTAMRWGAFVLVSAHVSGLKSRFCDKCERSNMARSA